MKLVIAMDSFKGCLSSIEANVAVAEGFLQADPGIRIAHIPIADGGEGTVEALVHANEGKLIEARVTGPLGEPVMSTYGIIGGGKIAVIEVAEACGFPLLTKEQRNPLMTTTYGVGELILDALNRGCHEFIIGLGGSATNDAGMGMLQALGFKFLDQKGQELGFGGGKLKFLAKMDSSNVSSAVIDSVFSIACDVNNPLYGPLGAAYIYGPQKGATEAVVNELDEGLRHFAKVAFQDLSLDLQEIPGAGAAGGLGAAFAGFLQGKLESGAGLVLGKTALEERIREADLVITGEGKLDGQTSMGKAPAGVALIAAKYKVPVVALAGDVSEGTSNLHESGISAYFTIVGGPVDLESAMQPDAARENLRKAAEQIGRLLKIKF